LIDKTTRTNVSGVNTRHTMRVFSTYEIE